ncbi:MAG: uncharacterized protein QOH62_3468 [Solirubrobacteraceae bacterium]|nr:uncharacterized protein [Solirubrobacteraceae bacterium]
MHSPVLDAPDLVLLAGAAFLAGAVNAIAGGGSLITFPALLAVGYPSITANVTNAIAVLPGYLGGSHAYRRELEGQGGDVRILGTVSAVGALCGALLLVVSSQTLFDRLVPWLILFSCGLLALQPALARRARRRHGDSKRLPTQLLALQFVAAVYGGYFGAGFGIVVLALLGIYLEGGMHEINALKGVLSLIVGLAAAVFFTFFGPVAWTAAAAMAVTSLIGGHVGVRLVRRLPPEVLRGLVVVFGVAVAIRLML